MQAFGGLLKNANFHRGIFLTLLEFIAELFMNTAVFKLNRVEF